MPRALISVERLMRHFDVVKLEKEQPGRRKPVYSCLMKKFKVSHEWTIGVSYKSMQDAINRAYGKWLTERRKWAAEPPR